MIRTILVAAATSFATATAWAHSGHGPVFVDGHNHVTTAAIVVAAIAVAALAWIAFRNRQSR